MYWAIDDKGNKYFPMLHNENLSNEELEKSLYWEEGNEKAVKIATVRAYYEAITTEADNGGYGEEDAGIIKSCKNVYDFLRSGFLDPVIITLYPHELTDNVISKIAAACKKNHWHDETSYTASELINAVITEYNGEPIPEFLEDAKKYNGDLGFPFWEIVGYFWDIDCGVYQCLYD